MKYVIVIADGAGDVGIEALEGKTALEAARTPNLDRLARRGRVGTAVTTPRGFEAGSDVCSMCLLGYDPARYHTGRAPLEAAAMGIRLRDTDWVFRMNFVTLGEDGTAEAGLMVDHSAGAISGEEGRALGAGLVEHWRRVAPELAADFSLTPGVSYRNILVQSAGPGTGGREFGAIRTDPPHEIPRRPWREHSPRAAGGAGAGKGAEAARVLNGLMDEARAFLPGHAVNRARVAAGKRAANGVWIWGQGKKPAMPGFAERYGVERGAMITAVDLLAGIAALIGWEKVECPGISSYHDTDYAEQGRRTCAAVDEFGIVCSHVESPDEASHQGDWKTKVAAIEAIDAHVVGPVVEHLERRYAGAWRVLVMPDHYTRVDTRKHDGTPPPWVLAGTGVEADAAERFTEREAARGERVEPGDGIMGMLVGGKDRPRRHGGTERSL